MTLVPSQVLDDTFGAAWDPFCAAVQPAGAAWRCFHAQYWPAATTVGAVPSLFLEYLYDLANVCASLTWLFPVPILFLLIQNSTSLALK